MSFTGTAASKLDGLAFCVYAHKLPVCTTEFCAQQVFFCTVHTFRLISMIRPSRISLSSPDMLVLTIWHPFFGLVL